MESPVAQLRSYVESLEGSADRPEQKIRRFRSVREELVDVLGRVDTYISQCEQRLEAADIAAAEQGQLRREGES